MWTGIFNTFILLAISSNSDFKSAFNFGVEKAFSQALFISSLRIFLLQNLQLVNKRYIWSINLKAIQKSMENLKSFPISNVIEKNNKEALCIYGANSNYVTNHNLEVFSIVLQGPVLLPVQQAGRQEGGGRGGGLEAGQFIQSAR